MHMTQHNAYKKSCLVRMTRFVEPFKLIIDFSDFQLLQRRRMIHLLNLASLRKHIMFLLYFESENVVDKIFCALKEQCYAS